MPPDPAVEARSPASLMSALRALRRPGVAELQTRDGLLAHAEPGGNILLDFSGGQGLADQAVPLIVERDDLTPFLALRDHRVNYGALDDHVGLDHTADDLALSGIGEHEDELLSPVGLLLLRADDSKSESVTDGVKYSTITVGQHDPDTAAAGLGYPAFSIGESSKVAGKRTIAPVSHVLRIPVVNAVAVPVVEWIACRLAAVEHLREVAA